MINRQGRIDVRKTLGILLVPLVATVLFFSSASHVRRPLVSADLIGTWTARRPANLPAQKKTSSSESETLTLVLSKDGSYKASMDSHGRWLVKDLTVELYPQERVSFLLQLAEALDPTHRYLTDGKCIKYQIQPGPPPVLYWKRSSDRKGIRFER
jgi:hypothetical protein